MLSFAVYKDGQPASSVELAGSYLIGSDGVPLRAELTYRKGVIQCRKRSAGPAGLVLLWPIEGVGSVLVETVRLMERDRPYVLQVELARGRLMHISQKLEDWLMDDIEGVDVVLEEIRQGRELLIRALQADTPEEAARVADESLSCAVRASENLSEIHSHAQYERRKAAGGFRRLVFGCSVDLDASTDLVHKRLSEAVDFVTVPIIWRDIEPNEQTFNWRQLDAWVESLARQRIPIKGSSLLSFRENNVPDWLYIWEHDFDAIRDLAFEHVRRVINRYSQYIQIWDVISGIHATNCFTFNFEQQIELTRMAAALTKQSAPKSLAILEIIVPWGEYYARNQRTIPPQLYADMAVQSGVNFDAFGLQFQFGATVDGFFTRDMFQVSSLIDAFAKPGKALHITGAQVPSHTDPQAQPSAGYWHGAWSEEIQAQWLHKFYETALSKAVVDTISWRGLIDHKRHPTPYGGLLNSGLAPKAAYHKLQEVRTSTHPASRKTS